MRRKRLTLLTVCCLLMIWCALLPAASAAGDIQMVVNGQRLSPDVALLISQGRVLAPARAIFEALNANVAWSGATRTVTVIRGNEQVVLTIGSTRMAVNGSPVTFDSPPIIAEGRTMVPVRSLAEALGASVSWDSATSTVSITLPQAGGVLQIGLIASLTGDIKDWGVPMANGFKLYLSEHQYRIGCFKALLIIGDDRNMATEATNVATKLVTQDQVGAIVGPITTKCAIPVSTVCEQYHVPMITPTATNPKVTVDNGIRREYAFQVSVADPYQGTAAAKFALQGLQARTAAVMFDQGNDYTIGLKDNFTSAFGQGGGRILDASAYSINDVDFSPVLNKIKALQPDVLYLPDYCVKVCLIAKEAREMGIKAVFLGSDGWDSSSIDWAALDGGFFTTLASVDDPAPAMQAWVQKYREAYQAGPDSFAVLGYNAAAALDRAVSAAGSSDPAKIRDALQGLKGVPTPLGSISIDVDGRAVMPMTIIQIKDGHKFFYVTVSP